MKHNIQRGIPFRKIKVVMPGVRGEFSSSVGSGIPKYMYEMYNRMKSLDSLSVEKLEYPRMPLSRKLPFLNAASFRLNAYLTDFDKYDIVHNLNSGATLPISKIKKPVVITTINDFMPFLSPESMLSVPQIEGIGSSAKRLVLKSALVLSYQATSEGLRSALKSDFLIANSTQTKEEAIKFGYDKRKIFVTWIGLDERYFSATKKEPKSSKHGFTVGYIGALGYRRNMNLAIKAFRSVRGDNVRFRIWGDRTLESHELDEEANKDRRVQFMGFAPEEKIIDIFDSFDAFIFPSLYEGFGRPIIEAQSRGLPVIVYRNGKIPEEVRKYCFEAEDEEHMAQIIEELKENGYDDKRRKKATEYARSFTWEQTIQKTLEAYKKVIRDPA